MNEAIERSAVYGHFAAAFRYPDFSDNVQQGVEYNEAFELSVSKYATSLNESSYVSHQQDSLLEELVRFYDHFGLQRTEDSELPDHLSIELEFMHFLTHLEDKAHQRGEPVDGLRQAQRDYIERHLQHLAKGVAKGYSGDNPFYIELIRDLNDFVEQELVELK